MWKKQITVAVLASLSLAPTARGAVNNVFLTKPLRDARLLGDVRNTLAPKKLEYYGGPVLSNVRAYAVMWGSNVNAEVESRIGDMLSVTVNSSYMDMLSQYSTNLNAVGGQPGTNQRIGRGSFGGTHRIQPGITKVDLDDTEVGAEIERQIEAGQLPRPDANSLYFLYFPPGVSITIDGSKSCEVFCGYHHSVKTRAYGQVYYAVQPDLGGACSMGCGLAANMFENMTVITSHELTEAVTDPAVEGSADFGPPISWVTNQGSEIGDLCSSELTSVTSRDGKVFRLQQAFDNTIRRCNKGPFRE